jgi:hypothetical protein
MILLFYEKFNKKNPMNFFTGLSLKQLNMKIYNENSYLSVD